MTKRLATTFLLTTCLMATPVLAETTPASVIGTWTTGVGEQPAPDGSVAYIQVTTVFTEEFQDFIFAIFADDALQTPLFTYTSSGPWEPQGPSDAVPGALEVNMINDFSRVEIFVDAPELWSALNMGNCPLEIGRAVDVSDCVSGPPFIVTDCVDLDLVMIDQDAQRLRFGADGVDRCETRPDQIGTIAYFRAD